MATDIDSAQAVIDLLNNKWTSANTDNVTPVFSKIYKQPKNDINFGDSRDYVLVFNPTSTTEESSLGGTANEDTFEIVTIDLRSKNRANDGVALDVDTHVRKVKTEIDRILKTNKVNPTVTSSDINNYDHINSTQQWQEMNDRYRGIFRYVKTIELVQYCRDYSS